MLCCFTVLTLTMLVKSSGEVPGVSQGKESSPTGTHTLLHSTLANKAVCTNNVLGEAVKITSVESNP